jgi:hypothetical protein
MRAFDAAGKHGRGIRLDSDGFETGLAGFDDLTHAGYSAAGADAGDEEVGFAISICPDLLGCRAAVDFRCPPSAPMRQNWHLE